MVYKFVTQHTMPDNGTYFESAKLCEDVGTSLVVGGRDGSSLFDFLTSTVGVAAADVLLYMQTFTFYTLIINHFYIKY